LEEPANAYCTCLPLRLKRGTAADQLGPTAFTVGLRPEPLPMSTFVEGTLVTGCMMPVIFYIATKKRNEKKKNFNAGLQ
jgi:hypothetical protein